MRCESDRGAPLRVVCCTHKLWLADSVHFTEQKVTGPSGWHISLSDLLNCVIYGDKSPSPICCNSDTYGSLLLGLIISSVWFNEISWPIFFDVADIIHSMDNTITRFIWLVLLLSVTLKCAVTFVRRVVSHTKRMTITVSHYLAPYIFIC